MESKQKQTCGGIILIRTFVLKVIYNERKILAHPLHKKWSFPLKISSVNVTKSAVSCGFGHITEEILNEKLHFLSSDHETIDRIAEQKKL